MQTQPHSDCGEAFQKKPESLIWKTRLYNRNQTPLPRPVALAGNRSRAQCDAQRRTGPRRAMADYNALLKATRIATRPKGFLAACKQAASASAQKFPPDAVSGCNAKPNGKPMQSACWHEKYVVTLQAVHANYNQGPERLQGVNEQLV